MPRTGLVVHLCICLLLPLAMPGTAAAVILYASEERNTAPLPGSIAYEPWNLQGQFAGFLATPIAPQYFITAKHIGGTSANRINFGGVNYTIDPAFGTNGKMEVPGSDLMIWKISGTFPSYAPLYTTGDEEGKHLVVIGRGTQRGEEVIVRGQLKGWRWGPADGIQSWGENTVTEITYFGPSAGETLRFEFDKDALPNEAALSAGDSGGGVFIQQDGVWKLAGINYSAGGMVSLDKNGTDPFMAALFDRHFLYEQYSDGTWRPATGPGSAYASRISTRTSFIYSVVPGAPVIQQEFTVLSNANMGYIQVTGTTQVGNGADPVELRAFHIRGGTLDIREHGRVILAPNGTDTAASRVARLLMGSTGVLDLANNDMIVQADAATWQTVLDDVHARIASARNSPTGLWTGPGITSSAAAINPLTGLAVIANRDTGGAAIFTSFAGLDVDANSILVKYTWTGDMNLDGKIDADDYFNIDSGFLRQDAISYATGDLNYDGRVDADDYFLIDKAFLSQTGLLGPTPMAQPVPEPGMGLLSLLAAAALGLRRRNR